VSIIVHRSDNIITKIDTPVKNVHRTCVLFATTDKKPPITAVLVCLMDSDVLLLFPARFIAYLSSVDTNQNARNIAANPNPIINTLPEVDAGSLPVSGNNTSSSFSSSSGGGSVAIIVDVGSLGVKVGIIGVAVSVSVCVGVIVAITVSVKSGVFVRVGNSVGVFVGISVSVGNSVGVLITVGVGISVGTSVGVLVGGGHFLALTGVVPKSINMTISKNIIFFISSPFPST